jgi:hypothetical protein
MKPPGPIQGARQTPALAAPSHFRLHSCTYVVGRAAAPASQKSKPPILELGIRKLGTIRFDAGKRAANEDTNATLEERTTRSRNVSFVKRMR